MNWTPCFELARAAARTHYLQKRCATPGVSTAPRGDVSCRGGTRLWDSTLCEFSKAAWTKRVRLERKRHCCAFVTPWRTQRALKHNFCVYAQCRMALTADLRQPSPSPLQLKCCCCWVALYPLLMSSSPPAFPSSSSSSPSASQVSMPALVLVDDVPAAAQLFPHVGHLLAKRRVLPFQKSSAHRDLVLLEPPGVPRALCGLVVLHAPAPVLIVLPLAAVEACWGVWGGRKEGEERGEEKRGKSAMMMNDDRKKGNEGGKVKENSHNYITVKPKQHFSFLTDSQMFWISTKVQMFG